MKQHFFQGLLAILIAAVSVCPFDAPDFDDDPLVVMPGLGPL